MLPKRYATVVLPYLLLLELPVVAAAEPPFSSGTAPVKRVDVSPAVQLDNGTFVGTSDGTISKFWGIPYVKPPTGDLRFRLPVPNDAYTGTHQVTAYGPSCPQLSSSLSTNVLALPLTTILFVLAKWSRPVSSENEDCLTVNVIAPAGTKQDAKLPVAVWIHGGGFSSGGSSPYDGTPIVQRSIKLGEPVIYVSMNYRLHGFGFLSSKEVKDAGLGNLGLQDQREALRWVRKYISAFGGDPEKVTIWGESAGAESVSVQMVTNSGDPEGLFRGAFMQSGSPVPTGDIVLGQEAYDAVVSKTGCSGAADTLQCLRGAPFSALKSAFDSASADSSSILTWVPRADGKFLVDHPQKLVQQGSIAKVPFVNGDCDDEGTLFSLPTLNLTTNAEFTAYIKAYYFPRISDSDLAALLEYYPANITQGSPFDTGTENVLSPEYKRHAALIGDLVFQAPRRFFQQYTASKQNTWMFLFKRYKYLGGLGSFHGTDVIDIYGEKDLTDYLINFVNHLDPNGASVPTWPKFSLDSRKLLTLLDGNIPVMIGEDDYRVKGMDLLNKVLLETPL
ncbi:alpha/beta-hydrolase [Ganoderma leucocontextum]|nr:alpha/beta-hydrolase [Ganoderma leucocontextum]